MHYLWEPSRWRHLTTHTKLLRFSSWSWSSSATCGPTVQPGPVEDWCTNWREWRVWLCYWDSHGLLGFSPGGQAGWYYCTCSPASTPCKVVFLYFFTTSDFKAHIDTTPFYLVLWEFTFALSAAWNVLVVWEGNESGNGRVLGRLSASHC